MAQVTEADFRKMTAAQQVALMNALQAERDAAVTAAASKQVITFKYRDPAEKYKGQGDEMVAGKGNILIYGINKQYPVSFYPNQLIALLTPENVEALLALAHKHLAPRK